MKNLNTIFDLLLFPFTFLLYLKKYNKSIALALFLSFIFIPSTLNAASEDCPGDNLNIVEGSPPITELNANNSDNYHQITIPSDGTLSIVFTNLDNKTSTFFVGTTCADINDIYDGTLTAVTHTVPSFTVQEGDTIQLLVDDTGNNENYTIAFDYTIASNTPDISIDPTAKSIIEGTSSVTLDVRLSEVANKDDINVTYEHNCTGSSTTTGIITFVKGDTEENLLIDTSSLTAGISCIATLSNPIGSGDQQVGSISPDTSTITVTAPTVVSVDLAITKTDSIDPVAISTAYSYTIDVTNNGTDAATNIVVTDTLPSGLTYLNTTGSDAVWSCSESSGIITCTHSGTIDPSGSNSIIVNVTAPSTEGTITNEANVTSDNEIDFSNNSTTESTTISDTSNPADLCYTNSIYTEDHPNTCSALTGFSYYLENTSYSCITSVDIRNQNTTELSNVFAYKVYTPGLNNGTCASPGNTCTGPEATSFGAGYEYDLDTILPDTNVTISDTDSWYSGGSIDDIILYAQYTKDGLHYSGEISACAGGLDVNEFTAQVDVVDLVYSNTSPYTGIIKTKVSNKDNYTLTAHYLGAYGEEPNSDATFSQVGSGGSALTIPMAITYFLTDGDCSDNVEIPLYVDYKDGPNSARVVSIIETGSSSDETDPFIMSYNEDNSNTLVENLLVKQVVRIKYKAVDLNTLFNYAGETCVGNSAIDGGIKGVPQCITSQVGNSTPAERYIKVFGAEAYARCWEGTDSDGDPTGSPCLSSNGGFGLPPYDNEYGCLECSIGEFPWVCSQDAFAIRPDNFDINNTTDLDFPNLLRAGEDYNMSIHARHYDTLGSTTKDYYQIKTNMDLNQTRYLANGDDDDGTLYGDLVWSAWDFHISNGISHQIGDYPALTYGDEAAGVQYNDVGKINLSIEDREWANIDINNLNDPTPHDCSPDGAYICGDKNVTYIPHHFGFSELNITNHAGPDSNFTYVADNRGMPSTTPPTRSPMAARVQTRIEALNKDNNITRNFRTGNLYYENNISVTQVVTVPAFGNPNGYLYPDANESNITNQLIGFGRSGLDDNGTRNIAWDEDTYPLEFNFQREINQPANPFDVNGSYYSSISLVSRYIDPDDGGIADINGSRISDQNGSTTCATDPGCVKDNADNNATFYYARSRSSWDFYEDIIDPSVLTPILIDVYCDLGFTGCDNYGIDTINGQINEINWWLSWNHSMNRGDGNITLEKGSVLEGSGPNWDVSPKIVNINTNAIDGSITVSQGVGAVLPLTVEIDLVTDDTATNYTNSWLIYNPYNAILAPSPFYKVRFIGQSDWAGHGDTGHVVDSNTSIKKNRRLEW